MTALDTTARATLRFAGIIDLLLGLALYAAPQTVMSTVAVRNSASSTILKLLGAQTAAAGVADIISSARPGARRHAVTATAIARIANAAALIFAPRSLTAGRRILGLLGVAELALGTVHLAHVITSDRD